MPSTVYLSTVQQYLTRYGMTTYIILGNIGLLLNIAIFIWPAYRRNPCSIYILAASFCGLIGLNISAVPVVYALDNTNPVTASLFFCQFQFYSRHSFNQMMRTYFIFACIDRYAISSNNVRIRSFSQYRTTIYIIICIPIFWLLLSIFPVMLRSLENGKCQGKPGSPSIILSVYISIVVGVVPLISMIIFGILMLKNLKNIRARVQPTGISSVIKYGLHKRDRDMMRMLLIETMCYITTTAPLSISLIYQAASQTVTKGNDQQRIESFITYFTGTFLIYFNNSLSFWIYIVVSRSFRLELKNLFLKCYELIAGKKIQINTLSTT
ncbi:unnamed protein product [Adineta steineri]|uniref:G-protein coupled receptors family 1 profile domain-containing protein n=1 Tax=Adineta steineri TaxID=433720 RepID=A0A814CRT7_9BILA|nr:unnamed protein product [Adineta steineri]CAF0943858.1 unnamed protein product [Adineta steineri]